MGDIVEGAKDIFEGVSLLVAGSLFLRQKERAHQAEAATQPLADVPNVEMQRPLVIAPGWNTEWHKFDFLTHKLLASGKNGEGVVYLKQGHAFKDAECSIPLDQIPKNSKVFVNIWDSRKSAPDVTAPQIKENLALIHEALGPDKIDLMGYSMGGLASRKYLNDGGSDVHNFMMLGTPNNGTRFGQMSARMITRNVEWALKFAGLNEEDKGAMEWLAAGAAKLEDLNAHWADQLARVNKALVVGGKPVLTPATGWLPFRKGDSMVEGRRLNIEGMEAHLLDGHVLLTHTTLPHDSQVYREMQQFFDWKAVPGSCGSFVKPSVEDDGTPYGQL